MNWHLDWQALGNKLTPQEIESQGLHLLHRALNTRRLIAFLGSGVSMAYGRVTWDELTRENFENIIVTNELDDSENDVAKELVEQFEKFKTLEGLSGARNAVALYLCEQYWGLVEEGKLGKLLTKFGIDQDRYQHVAPDAQPERGRWFFREAIKHETFDARANVLRIIMGSEVDEDRNKKLCRLVRHRADVQPMESGHDILNRLDVGLSPLGYLPFFKKDKLERLKRICDDESSKESLRECVRLLDVTIATLGDDNTNFLHPVRYFIVGLVLDLMRQDNSTGAATWIDSIYEEWNIDIESNKLPRRPPPRHEVIPQRHDPLLRLAHGLEIERFVTINYDLEVERLFHDLGFSAQPLGPVSSTLHSTERVGPLGGVARDMIVHGATAPDLIDFSLDNKHYKIEVVHLHGRATTDSDIVVTDRDYEAVYVRDTEHAETYRRGLDITFGGNPILFLGVGLGEGDLLRPLRQFLSSSARNRSIVALQPALYRAADREFYQIETYLRYGVHVLYYDLPRGNDERFEGYGCNFDASGKNDSILSLMSKLIEVGKKLIRAAEKKEKETTEEISISAYANCFVKEMNPECLSNFFDNLFDHNVYFEVDVLRGVLKYISNLRPNTISRKFADSLKAALDRALTALLTRALNERLEEMRGGWRDWWETWWREVPQDRMLGKRYERGENQKNCFVRHHIQAPGPEEQPTTASAFISACGAEKTLSAVGRRLFLILGPRGSGKGEFCGALEREEKIFGGRKKKYTARFFANLSQSCEIASIWDALALFIYAPNKFSRLDPLASPKSLAGTSEETLAKEGFLELPRLARLQRALDNIKSSKQRLLICLNAFDILFFDDGMPKNLEIRRICDLFFGKNAKDCPVDIVLSIRDDRLPAYFISETKRIVGMPGVQPRYSDVRTLSVAQLGSDGKGAGLIADRSRIDLTGSEGKPDAWVFLYSGQSIADSYNNIFKKFCFNLNYTQKLFSDILKNNSFRASLLVKIVRDCDGASKKSIIFSDVAHLVATGRDGDLSSFFDFVFDYWSQRTDFQKWDQRIRGQPIGGDPDRKNSLRLRARPALASDEQHKRLLDAATDNQLREVVLRHLAVIGFPVHEDVLVICSRVEEHLNRLLPVQKFSEGGDFENLIRDECLVYVLSLTLDLLWYYCGLATKVGSHDDNDEETHTRNDVPRFYVHRSIQLYVYRRLGAQSDEPTAGFLFTPSVYVTQERGLPQLTSGAYSFLYQLFDRLTGYPHRVGQSPAIASSPKPDPVVQSDRLRAALGVLRTLFSVGIVSRFAEAPALPVPKPPQMGYFEHHRLVIRWMLHAASTLGEKVASPFYRDEIVWLYNEAALFSLAQGQCDDAAPLFRMAIKLNREIEGSQGGAMHQRLELNAALCGVDRGRLSEARARFKAVRDAGTDENMLRILATGFIGLVDHLCGNMKSAERGYSEAITQLTILKRLRATSFFQRSYADLLRKMGRTQDARRHLDKAVQTAEAGGYVDFVHFAHVSDARLQLESDGKIQDLIPQLERADTYADMMDMPRLKGDVLRTRALILLCQNETTLAADFASRALRIANLNGLVLRRIAYTELLAKIYRRKGDINAADKLQQWAARSARNIGYMSSLYGVDS